MLVLKLGSVGEDVKALQQLLNAQLSPSPHLLTDGIFGPQTCAAVMRFQRANQLTPDGEVDPKTWEALGQPRATVPWMDIALAEYGVHENSLPGQHNQRVIEYHGATSLKATTDEVPWCSSFVNWVMRQAGHSGTNSALASSWLDWGRTLSSPEYGAITIIKRKVIASDRATGSSTGFHVAFYDSSTATHLRLLGGNQGDRVKYSDFSLRDYEVRGYRWPS
jgi:uncharacterized protein (TIGR02594 family)